MPICLRALVADERGVSTVEYALLLCLLVTAGVAAWRSLGDIIGNMVEQSTSQIANGPN